MKTPIPLPSAILQEDSLIRHLLANERTIMRPFPDSLEQRYWNTLQERSASMIRNVYFTFMLVYLALGFITFPTVYFVSEPVNRAHDLFLWLLAYTNGIVCLGVLPIMAHVPKILRYYNRILPMLAFLGVLGTCVFTMLFQQPQLAQQGSYLVIFVYMLAYFMSGMPPRTMLLTCALAGLIPLPLFIFMNIHIDPVMYFYAVILSNALGFLLAYLNTSRDRVSFLQGRLLELDRLQSRAMSEELIRLSREDSVTGLANRRYLNETFSQEWERAQRSGEPLSVIFVDIDHFKAYNDTYGHLQGDDALTQVANVLKSHLQRTGDLAARYGGEEFIVLMPNTPPEGAKRVAEKILAAVDRLNITHHGSHTASHVTVSIGVSTWQPLKQRQMNANRLIDQADSAVYQAKAAGRHCIRVFEAERVE